MSGLGTDVMALACILGSAGAAGAVTLAVVDRGTPAELAQPCFVETTGGPVVVSIGDGETHRIVMTPNSSSRRQMRCAVPIVTSDVAVRMDGSRVRVERVRRDVERARQDVERALQDVERVRVRIREVNRSRMDEVRRETELRAEELERARTALKAEFEARLEEGLEPALEADARASLEAALRDLELQLESLRERGGR